MGKRLDRAGRSSFLGQSVQGKLDLISSCPNGLPIPQRRISSEDIGGNGRTAWGDEHSLRLARRHTGVRLLAVIQKGTCLLTVIDKNPTCVSMSMKKGERNFPSTRLMPSLTGELPFPSPRYWTSSSRRKLFTAAPLASVGHICLAIDPLIQCSWTAMLCPASLHIIYVHTRARLDRGGP